MATQNRTNLGIACPDCGETYNRVLYTRSQIGYITRRRQCQNCQTRFTTVERRASNHADQITRDSQQAKDD